MPLADQSKICIALSPPYKSVEHVMRQLRESQQRDEIYFSRFPIPIAAEKPLPLVPHTTVPEQLFYIRQSPKRSQKYKPILRKRAINAAGIFAAGTRVNVDQCKVRHAVDDDVRHRESVIGVEIHDADVPADRSRHDNDILSDIRESENGILIDRLDRVCGKCRNIDRKQNSLDHR